MKPVIGIVGGIGSGKSTVARLFGELGCRVADADAAVRACYADPAVREQLRAWWGDGVFAADGSVDRRAVAARVFGNGPGSAAERGRLERLVHAYAAADRDAVTAAANADPGTVAVVWDVPLLVEVGLAERCDAVVFVDAPADVRAARVAARSGWPADELTRRENLQSPLDKKRAAAQYVLDSTADAETLRGHVRAVLHRILEKRP